MWLVTTSVVAVGVTAAKFVLPKKYNLGFLALMLWGAVIMILVDHILGYEGGRFIETTTDGMIGSGFVLGIVMLVPVFLTWAISIFLSSLEKKRAEGLPRVYPRGNEQGFPGQ